MDGTQLQIDEATPLLSASSASYREQRPAVLPAVRQYGVGDSDSNGSDTLDSHTFSSDAERTAFLLLVQLHYLETQYISPGNSSDIWENSPAGHQAAVASSVVEDTRRRASEILDRFLMNHSSFSEIQTIFWMAFPLESTEDTTVRVVDILMEEHIPPQLLLHPLVEVIIMKGWKYGMNTKSSQRRSLTERFDALSTPRVLHFIDIMSQLTFMGSLIHYLLYPPLFHITLGHNEQKAREIFLTFMAAASLARPWSMHTLPAMLVFPAFLLTLPSVPLPGSTSFSVLHVAFLLQLTLLHFPNSPSLPVAINPKHAIPLSTLLLRGVTRVFMPVALFFLPALLLAAYLVSASLADTFLLALPKYLETPPTDSRFLFFVLLIAVVVSLLGALGMTFAIFPTLVSSSASTSKWDRYSREIGLHARRTFVEALVQYDYYYFPIPFNMLQVLVRVPCVVFSCFGHPVIPYMKSVERGLWRVSVGLIGAVISSLWLWGLV